MHSLPDHGWLLWLADGQAHQWPLPHTPDAEGIVRAVCEAEAVPSRLAEEGTVGRCVCGFALTMATEATWTQCYRCDRRWSAAEWPQSVISFDGVHCFTCLLRAGDDFADLLTARLPDAAEFRHAVSKMRTDGPDRNDPQHQHEE